MANELEQTVLKKAQAWLDGHYDEETKKQVKYLMENDMKELVESFYKDLEFGTGGLRGIMGVGTNRMNVYTVGAATQGLSNYLKRTFAGEQVRVAVAHDSRNNSRMFAERVADIFASNGFRVYLFDTLRPTPELSFAIRELKCHSGVVVTASHNPKEYNGYKAYWTDGAQVTPTTTACCWATGTDGRWSAAARCSSPTTSSGRARSWSPSHAGTATRRPSWSSTGWWPRTRAWRTSSSRCATD